MDMKNIYRIILIIILCTGVLPVCAQSNYYAAMPDVTPPSPTSRVFQKFLGYPISHATGTIDISIPLYTVEAYGLSLPLTLKYHSSGVRVQDPVGVVGRNWALFPGFKISRTIMGKPDEVYPVADVSGNLTRDDYIYMSSPYSNDCDCWNERGHIYPCMDGQYDVFQINMPGMDASFILQRVNGVDVVKQISDTPLKITPKLDNSTNFISTRLYGFEILDDKGIRYAFGEKNPVHGLSSPQKYVEYQPYGSCFCGWMLREIIFPGNEKISFTYQSVREDVPTFNHTLSVLDNGKSMWLAGCFHNDMIDSSTGSDSSFWRILGGDGYQINEGRDSPYSYINRSLVPDSIIIPNGLIDLNYSAGKLASLNVKQSSGIQVRNVQFTYDTTTGNLLKKVNINGEGNYLFTYKNESSFSYLRSGFDWWGFYNEADFGDADLPNINLEIRKTTGSLNVPVNRTIGNRANRKPNAAYMDTYSLTEMLSPTKGKLKISYEPHRFTVKRKEEIGGGLRVKSTELYDPVSGKTIVKNYTYEDAHFIGTDYPDEKSLITTRYICPLDDGGCRVRQRTLSVFSGFPNVRGNTNPVWYGKITEVASDWKKVYQYDFRPDEYDNVIFDDLSPDYSLNNECLLSAMNRMLYPIPWLLSENFYRKSGNIYEKVQSLTNMYEKSEMKMPAAIVTPYQFGLNGYSSCQFMEKLIACPSYNYCDVYGSPVKSFPYYIATGYHRLKSTCKTTYQSSDSIVEKSVFAYDTERPYNIISKSSLCSGGAEQVERTYYSNNTIPDKESLTTPQRSAIQLLTSRNYLTTPVQQTMEKKDKRLYSVLRGYSSSLSSGMVVEDQYYCKGTDKYEKRISYNKYDIYGNPVYFNKDGAEKVVYLWGYKGQYLLAEIKGATYEEVKKALMVDPASMSSCILPSIPLYLNMIDNLYKALPSALITSYTYHPLIGISGIISPNKAKTTFEYNSDSQLIRIKDTEGKTMEEYQYHFRP